MWSSFVMSLFLYSITTCIHRVSGLSRTISGRNGRILSQRFSSVLRMNAMPINIAFQGESGAYSEKAARELLGTRVTTVPYKSFEDTFKAVASREADYAVVPIENSLGGSIHINYDLLLRYDLHIIGEHEFRVEHSLLALPGVKREDIKKVMSHPQALAQCDNYLRTWGVDREEAYDTAGSAKMIKDNNLRDCAAIASDLAGLTYGLEVLDSNIEDWDNNFTRFLLLSREPVNTMIPPTLPAKTSIVFVTPNDPGALYKALACFTLRDIDFCKIESRPTSVKLLEFLQMKNEQESASASASASAPASASSTTSPTTLPEATEKRGRNSGSNTIAVPSATGRGNGYGQQPNRNRQDSSSTGASQDLPRFRYTFYLEFLASELEDRTQNALHHLREQSQFVRVLGSYPKSSQLVGPVKNSIDALSKVSGGPDFLSNTPLSVSRKAAGKDPLRIGIIGFGKFGQFLAKTFVKNNEVHVISKSDNSAMAKEIGCDFYPFFDMSSFAKVDFDVILLSVSIISFNEVLQSLPKDLLRGKLIVDVLSVKVHARNVMESVLPPDCDILCTHPMFGPESGRFGWQGLPFLYEKTRVTDVDRCDRFLQLWEAERCKMIEMSCEQHDEYAANSQFITHLTGRILDKQNLAPTPIDTKGFQTVLNLVDNTCKDSFDLFFGLYFYNKYAGIQLQKIREALAQVERQLAAKEAYLAAKSEFDNNQRSRILEEARALMREALLETNGSNGPDSSSVGDKTT